MSEARIHPTTEALEAHRFALLHDDDGWCEVCQTEAIVVDRVRVATAVNSLVRVRHVEGARDQEAAWVMLADVLAILDAA